MKCVCECGKPSDIRAEQQMISDADVLTWIYPLRWTGLPAILKGYVDRFFADGYTWLCA